MVSGIGKEKVLAANKAASEVLQRIPTHEVNAA
jgi:hypothetical protein